MNANKAEKVEPVSAIEAAFGRPIPRRGVLQLGLAATSIGALLAACERAADQTGIPSASAASLSPASAPTSLGLVRWLGEVADDPPTIELIAGIISDFEAANPGSDIEREELPFDALQGALRTRLASDSASPDLLDSDAGIGHGGPLAEAGLVQPLEDAYERFGWKVNPFSRATATYFDHTWAVPPDVESYGLWYNKDMFDDLGVTSFPTTTSELESVADKLVANGVTPFASGILDGWPAYYQFDLIVNSWLGVPRLKELVFGNGGWDQSDVVDAIDAWFRQYLAKGYFPEGSAGINYDDAHNLFATGKAAMMPTGSWQIGQIILSDPGFDFRFAQGLPTRDGSPAPIPMLSGKAFFVPTHSGNLEGSLQFIDYYLSPEIATKLAELYNIPSTPIPTEGLDVPVAFKEIVDAAQASLASGNFGLELSGFAPPSFNDEMTIGFPEVVNGSRSPAEMGRALEDAYQTAKAAGQTRTEFNTDF